MVTLIITLQRLAGRYLFQSGGHVNHTYASTTAHPIYGYCGLGGLRSSNIHTAFVRQDDSWSIQSLGSCGSRSRIILSSILCCWFFRMRNIIRIPARADAHLQLLEAALSTPVTLRKHAGVAPNAHFLPVYLAPVSRIFSSDVSCLVPTPSGRRTPFSILRCSYESIAYKWFHGTSDLGLEGSHERISLLLPIQLTLSLTKFMQLLSLANMCSNAIEAIDVHNIKINIIAFYHRRISTSRTAQLRYSW